MWLDRLSGHSTPSASPLPAQNRSYSPATRRPNHLAPVVAVRPSYGPRTSSLGLGSHPNVSTTSLNSPRLQNGSSLKQEITLPADITDPLGALESIIGRSLRSEVNERPGANESAALKKPTHLQEDVDFSGLSLQEFVDQPTNGDNQGSRFSGSQPVEEFESEKDRFGDLHQSILACDDVLKSVQTSLTVFQKDLGAVSAEIETLQSRSAAMNTKLENRKVVERLLGPAVEEVSIAPGVVKTLSEGQIDSNWINALGMLDKCSKTVAVQTDAPSTILSVSDIKPLLVDLTNKAIERIRDFFVAQIKALRFPSINAQIIQQQSFIKYKDLYRFLSKHHSQLAEEIGQAYINTMRWYYLSNFTRYRQALERMSVFIVDKLDAIGVDPTSATKASQPPHDPLSLGRRIDILKRSNSTALPSHLTENRQTHYLETPFFHFNLALLDNATAEYSFLTTFFSPNSTLQTHSRQFSAIFGPTFALGQTLTKSLIENSDDCLGILLCVRLNQSFAFELQRRRTPIADGYINGTNMHLWPRFQVAMDTHSESVRRATASISVRGAASTLGLGIGADAASRQTTAPHMLAQRFGQFLQGILTLSQDTGDDEPVSNSLGRLRSEVEAFLTKVGKGFGSSGERKRERFLANNYSLLLTIIGETEGKLAGEVREHFEGLRERAGGT